jgi:hypothetical protein
MKTSTLACGCIYAGDQPVVGDGFKPCPVMATLLAAQRIQRQKVREARVKGQLGQVPRGTLRNEEKTLRGVRDQISTHLAAKVAPVKQHPISKSQLRAMTILNLEPLTADTTYSDAARILSEAVYPSDGVPIGFTWRSAAALDDAHLLGALAHSKRVLLDRMSQSVESDQ